MRIRPPGTGCGGGGEESRWTRPTEIHASPGGAALRARVDPVRGARQPVDALGIVRCGERPHLLLAPLAGVVGEVGAMPFEGVLRHAEAA